MIPTRATGKPGGTPWVTGPVKMALQIIEADRVSNPDFKGDTHTLTQGIEKAPAGEPSAVHGCNRHPGRRGIYRAGHLSGNG